MEATKGKIIRIVERKQTNVKDTSWFYIIETDDGKQYEVISYSITKYYELGDTILADNYHYNNKFFQEATIVKTVKDSE